MILGAYLLGNIAALVVKGSNTEKFRDKMTDLIKYMNRNKLDKQTSKKIKDHLRLQFDRSYTNASGLQDIPVSIRHQVLIMLVFLLFFFFFFFFFEPLLVNWKRLICMPMLVFHSCIFVYSCCLFAFFFSPSFLFNRQHN